MESSKVFFSWLNWGREIGTLSGKSRFGEISFDLARWAVFFFPRVGWVLKKGLLHGTQFYGGLHGTHKIPLIRFVF